MTVNAEHEEESPFDPVELDSVGSVATPLSAFDPVEAAGAMALKVSLKTYALQRRLHE